MEDNKNIHDQLLKNLISKTSLEKPSDSFSDRLMNKLMLEATPVRQGSFSTLKAYIPYFSGIAAVIAIVILVYIGWDRIEVYINPSNIQTETLGNMFISFTTGFASLGAIFKNLVGSSVAIISIISVISFFILDKIIRDLVPGRQNVSVF